MPHTALFHTENPRLDAARIAGISAALLLNAALGMVLLRPISLAPLIEAITPIPPVVIIEPLPEKLVDPVTLPVSKPKVTQQNVKVARSTPTLTTTPQQIDVQTVVTDTTPMTDTIGPMTINTTPMQTTPIEASLSYLRAPAPPYPRDALRSDIEGTVQLRVLVDTNGAVLDVRIERSSGNRELDAAARDQVLRHWMFQPAQRNGVRMQAWGRVPIVFTLGGN